MSSEAPPPPPEEPTTDSAGGEPTVAFPTRKSALAEAPTKTSSFDSEVLSEPTVTVSGPATRALPQAERPQLRNQPVATGPRRVRMSISHVDPWSVMKLAFLLSVAIGIMTVVAAALVWSVLDSMEVFGKILDLFEELRVARLVELMQFLEFDSVLSISTLIAVLNIVLITALATIMALLYNVTAALVGGVHITMMDE